LFDAAVSFPPKAFDDVGGQQPDAALRQAVEVRDVEAFVNDGVHPGAFGTMLGMDAD
jgi:hypothetical protein